jgi:hypothetical protein
VRPSGLSSSNYAIGYLSGRLTVSPAHLTVKADDKSRAYGDANPAFTASITGFKNGETLATSGVSGAPICGSAATLSSTVTGSPYAISCGLGTLSAGNYDFSLVSGSLTIVKASPAVSWSSPANIVYGTALGSTQLNASSPVPGGLSYTPGAGTVLNAGPGQLLSVVFSPTDSVDYNSASASVLINVLKASQTIAFAPLASHTLGDGSFMLSASASSGLQVSFGASGPCSVSGNVLTITGGGACAVTATQGGNSNYTPAPSVTRAFTIACFPSPLPFAVLTPLGTYNVAQLNLSQDAASSGTGCVGTFTLTVPSGTGPVQVANGNFTASTSGPVATGTLTGAIPFGTQQLPFTVSITLDTSTHMGSLVERFPVGSYTTTVTVNFTRDATGLYVITTVTITRS